MKRLAFVLIFLTVIFVPTGSAFAQEDTPTLPFYCELDYLLEELMLRVSSIQELEDLGSVVDFALTTVMECAEPVLNMLMDELFGEMIDTSLDNGDAVTITFDPNDGVMEADEAEFVISSAFSGDIVTANLYLCEDEQINQEDFESLGEVTVDFITCTEGGNSVTCDYSVTFQLEGSEPTPFAQTTTFEVVAGKLCSATTE